MAADPVAPIHLVTCVGVDTEYAHLPHFITHYRALGVSPRRFHVILNAANAASKNLERARVLLRENAIPEPQTWIAPYTSDCMWAKRRETQARLVPPADWVISADVDEFHEYPQALAPFLAACQARGVNCVQGVFIDRLAATGRLVPVAAEAAIEKTFPIQADVQCTVGQTGAHHDWFGTVKVMACKGALLPSRGGHHPQQSDVPVRYLFGRHLATFPKIGEARFRFAVPLRVHHYKWTASMPETLRRRLATPGVSAAGAEYGQKLLDYCEQNDGIRLSDVPIRRPRSAGGQPWRLRLAYLRALDAVYWYRGKPRRLLGRALKRLTP